MTDFSLFNKMVEDMAAGLREAIEATPTDQLERNPKSAFTDLACRLILGVSGTVSIKPIEAIRVSQTEAAARIFDVFTRWMEGHPERSYSVRVSSSGKFQVAMKDSGSTQLFFGESAQDACAQAAQTLCLEEASV